MFIIPALTSDILAINFDVISSPSIKISQAVPNPIADGNGWGFAWYPGDHQAAIVAKDPLTRGSQVLMDALIDWSKFRSTVFFCKVRAPSKGYTHTETQPFSRSYAGRDWIFLHNGDLDKSALEQLMGNQPPVFEPLGNTDSELAFCYLLSHLQQLGIRRLADLDSQQLYNWLHNLDALGSADMIFSDGESLVIFHGSQSPKPLFHTRVQPPNQEENYDSDIMRFALKDPRDSYHTAFVVSSAVFSQGNWQAMLPEQMLLTRRGAIVWDSHPNIPAQPLSKEAQQQVSFAGDQAPPPNTPPPQQILITTARAITHTPEGHPLGYRLFEVKHTTQYEYTKAVEHSTHFFRLQPVDDPLQEVVNSILTISCPAEEIQYEDVFGNQSIHCIINTPYTLLKVEAVSHVKIFASPPDDHSYSLRQTSIPLAWMPWQRQMMMAYLLPHELPESQLTELTDYAMSFVERNNYHLLNIIEDINLSIYRDYQYVPGTTALSTTPFQVYTSRQGVCQDFANLFICLTRLLSIPARYRMGYIYTGANYANKIQSEASHAWAEVYMPYIGWRGYDPTNGCRVSQDHVRVACGRNFRDATPTAGTLYKGGGKETLTVDVKMRELHDWNAN